MSVKMSALDGKLYQDTPLGEWFLGKSGVVNQSLIFRKEATGHRLEAACDIEPSTELVSMPYELAVTPKMIRAALPTELTEGLGNRTTICLYLMLHDLALEGLQIPYELKHIEYAKTLPRPQQLQTAMWFTDAEFELLNGSNLYPAVLDRREEWKAKHAYMLKKLEGKLPFDMGLLTWKRYLWAQTTLSSRAFPSYLLDGVRENATQIFLPCIDVFNHKYATAVTWFSDHKNKRMQLITDEPIPAGNEVFNNYGAKPNDELILGYGFVLEDNPADIISLRFGAQGNDERIKLLESLSIPISKSHYIRKDIGSLPEELKAQVRILVADDAEMEQIQAKTQRETSDEPWKSAASFVSWPNELEMLDQLAGMFEAKSVSVQRALDRTQAAARLSNGKKRQRCSSPGSLASPPDGTAERSQESIREDIRAMIEIYLHGQMQLLEHCLVVQGQEFDATVEKARADGFAVEEEEDMSEEEDE